MRLKILMVSWDLSANSLVRTYPFAKFLSKEHDVIVIGYCSSDIFPYYKDDKNITYLPIKNKKKVISEIIRHAKQSDIIHCFKFVPGSFIPSLIAKFVTRKKLILDIEDYETAWTPSFKMKLSEKLTFLADKKIISTRFLEKKFGGKYIPTGINIELFSPKKSGSKKLRKKLKIKSNETVVMFTGTFKFYKGCGELIRACEELAKAGEKIKCVFVGNVEDYHKELIKKVFPKQKSVLFHPPVAFEKLPEIIRGADIMVVPQAKGVGEAAQIPAKVFDAMAMGKPVIVTDVGDLKEVIGEGGIVIEGFEHIGSEKDVYDMKNDVTELKNAIKKLIKSKRLRESLGKKARKRCIENYSWKVMKQRTLEVYSSL